MNKFVDSYLDKLAVALSKVSRDEVAKIVERLDEAEKEKGTIYIIGNGGSAATASHMANDLSAGLRLREIRNFQVVSLADNSSTCTAIANDVGFENIFYVQLKPVLKPQDVLIAISCSGNSPNIMKAVNYAKAEKVTVIGLTGFDGGELKAASDINYHVATERGEYGIVEDAHMILDHMLFSYYVSLKPETKTNYTMV